MLRLHAPSLRLSQTLLRGPALRYPALTDLRAALINALFGNGEEGALYDPSDLSTMYQDSNATIPVTGADQPVRMLLDLSKERALGPELHTPNLSDPAWDSNVEAWVMYRTAEESRHYTTNATITAGKWYVLDFMASHDPQQPTSSAVFRVGPSSFGFLSIHGLPVEPTRYVRIVEAATSGEISAYGGDGNGESWRLHSLSVKEIAGNHAMAPSDASRPMLRTDGTYWWLEFDGVDDTLVSTFSPVMPQPVAYFWAGITQSLVSGGIAGFRSDVQRNTVNNRLQVFAGTAAASSASITATAGETYVGNLLVNGASTKAGKNGVELVLSVNPGPDSVSQIRFAYVPGGGGSYSALSLSGYIVLGRVYTTDELSSVSQWLASKSGVQLP